MPDGYSIEHKTLFDKLDKIYKQTMWDKVTHDFGQIKPNTTVKAEFIYNGKAQIKQVTASCGCTLVDYKKGSNLIEAEYTSPNFPQHLLHSGVAESNIAKSITVTFNDRSEQVLIIKATLIP